MKNLCNAHKANISGLKGHRSVGGFRASMYNAMPLESVKTLVDVMQELTNKKDKMNILANDGLSKSGINALKNTGFNVITDKVEQAKLIEYINSNSIEVILVRSATQVRKDIIDQCSSLRIIGRGGENGQHRCRLCKNKGLLVINTPAASSQSVAELVMAHLFNISRFVYDSNRQMPKEGIRLSKF